MLCLKENSQTDGTFDQNSAFKRILSIRSKRMYSFDLSSATDRMPVYLQFLLIKQIFGDKIATN
jgi:hypothetical protein